MSEQPRYGDPDFDYEAMALREWEDERHSRPATESEAHLEWHLNSGVPVGQPCPWDACDPGLQAHPDDETFWVHEMSEPLPEDVGEVPFTDVEVDEDDIPF